MFASDLITVETSDHARLQLDLQYNRHFQVDKDDQEEAKKLFSVADFVGDLCEAMASRIRGTVSSITFDDFHKNSSKIVQVFFTKQDQRSQKLTLGTKR